MPFTTSSLRLPVLSVLLATAAAQHQHLHRTKTVTVTDVAIVTDYATVTGSSAAVTVDVVTDVTTITTGAPAASSSTSSSVEVEATSTSAAVAVAVPTSSSSTSTSFATSVSVAAASSAAASTSSTTTTSAAASSTSSTSRKGLAYNDASLIAAWDDEDIGFIYNWASVSDADSTIPYVPMAYCPTDDALVDWATDAAAAIASGSTHVLSFNEPDESSQCDISVADAVAAHIEYLNPLNGQVKIGSPAVTNGGAPMGLTYLGDFLSECDGSCDVDFLAIHWYGTEASDFQTQVTDAIALGAEYGISEVWITEFGLDSATAEESAAFLETVVPWLNDEDGVGGYAFFYLADGYLSTGDAISSVIGEAYLTE